MTTNVINIAIACVKGWQINKLGTLGKAPDATYWHGMGSWSIDVAQAMRLLDEFESWQVEHHYGICKCIIELKSGGFVEAEGRTPAEAICRAWLTAKGKGTERC